MNKRVEKRKDAQGRDVDVHVIDDRTPEQAKQADHDARIAALEAALDSIRPGWRKGG